LKERTLQHSADSVGAWQADQNAGADHPEGIAQHNPNHVASSSTQRHANADFACSASDSVSEQTSESNGRKRQRDEDESPGDETQQPLGPKKKINQPRLGVKLGEWYGPIDGRHGVADCLSEIGGVDRRADSKVNGTPRYGR